MWDDIHGIFTGLKSYKGQELPQYGSQSDKNHLLRKIDMICQTRNEIYHNKPTKIKFTKEAEILLLRMDYNLKDALKLKSDNLLHLAYQYS